MTKWLNYKIRLAQSSIVVPNEQKEEQKEDYVKAAVVEMFERKS